MRRRKRLPEDLASAHTAFEVIVAEMGAATRALTEVMPTSRLPGRSLPDALVEFEERLARARDAMSGWRRPETEDAWVACDAGLDEALRRAGDLRETAPDLGGFEGLIWAVDRLTAPLDPFEVGAEMFRQLREFGSAGGPGTVV
jgi:hypothetical protein